MRRFRTYLRTAAALGAVTILATVAAVLAGSQPAAAVQAMTNPNGSATNANGTSGPPVITVNATLNHSGRVRVGTTLVCHQGSWANDPTSYKYRWKRNRATISTTTRDTYRVAGKDAGTKVSCFVIARNPQGTGVAAYAGGVQILKR